MLVCLCQIISACGGGGGSPPVQTQPPIFTPTVHPQQIHADFFAQPGLQQTGLAFLIDVNGARQVTEARLVQDAGLADRNYLSFDGDTFELTSNVNIDGLQLFSDTSDPLDVFQTFDPIFTNWESNQGRVLFKKILILKPDNDDNGLSYTSLAYWVDGLAPKLTVGAIVVGAPVTANQIPDVGSASFDGLMRGFMTGDDQVWELQADFNASVNFSTGALSGGFSNGTKIDMIRDDLSLFDSHVTDLEFPDRILMPENFTDTFDWNLTGSITSGQNLFGGTLNGAGDGTGWAGQFTGSFFGSGRVGIPEELGGLWNATNTLGHVAGGAFVGKNE